MKILSTNIPLKRILGIDPGTNILGFALIDIYKKNIKVVKIGVIRMAHLSEHSHKLKEIFVQLNQLIKQFSPTEMAVEAPFFGKNVQSMLKLGRAQGVAIAAAITNDVEITEYAPKKIKVAIVGNGNASKEQVLKMLESILKVKLSDQLHDATDALATAVCHHYQTKNPLMNGKKYANWSSFVANNPSRKK